MEFIEFTGRSVGSPLYTSTYALFINLLKADICNESLLSNWRMETQEQRCDHEILLQIYELIFDPTALICV